MKKILLFATLLSTLAIVADCADCRAQENNDKKVVLTLGDSNGSFKWSWPVMLKNLIPEMDFINNSESGRTIGQTNLGRESLNGCLIIDGIMEDVNKQLAGRDLEFIVVCFGTNDAKVDFKDKTAEFKGNLETFLTKIENSAAYKQHKPQIILVTPFPMDENHEKFIAAKYEGGTERIGGFCKDMEAVAAERGYIFVDVYKHMMINMINKGTTDGVHIMPELSAYVAGRIGAQITAPVASRSSSPL